MNIKAIAIDDEPLALEIVKQYCTQLNEIDLVQIFDNTVEAKTYIDQHQPDLIFIDIDMPDINGIDLVNSISFKPMIVFTTAYKEFALDGFELEAIDYLLKPFSFERFEKAFQKAFSKYKTNQQTNVDDHIFVYAEYKMTKISLQEILFIESLDDYIKIHLSNEKPVMTLMSLKKIIEKIPASQFIRIHRSYIASIKYLSQLSGRKVKLTNGAELPVSEKYASELARWVKTP